MPILQHDFEIGVRWIDMKQQCERIVGSVQLVVSSL